MSAKKLCLTLGIFLSLILIGMGCGKDSPNVSVKEEDNLPAVGANKDASAEEDVSIDSDSGESDFVGWKTYEQDGITLKYPPNWRVSEDGILYRWREGLEEEFASQDYFEHLTRMAEVSIGINVRENVEGDDVDDLIKYVDYNGTLQERIYIDGHGALIVACGGINYAECVLFNNKEASIIIFINYMLNGDREPTEIKTEVEKILQTVRLP
ncbi:MAG: hypothetical protein PHD51_00360 [Patescibacteria group bacterium]|nr:hypothetical protein [Patescibacteria group bacterium]MDD5490680.1 hypothetical protein [Patescibacteria group bacterium]